MHLMNIPKSEDIRTESCVFFCFYYLKIEIFVVSDYRYCMQFYALRVNQFMRKNKFFESIKPKISSMKK